MSTPIADPMGIGNADFGYVAYGLSPGGYKLSTDRIDYSNDTATALVKGTLSSPGDRKFAGATGNQSFGYIMGGNTSSPLTLIERIDYSNDSGSSSPKGNGDSSSLL